MRTMAIKIFGLIGLVSIMILAGCQTMPELSAERNAVEEKCFSNVSAAEVAKANNPVSASKHAFKTDDAKNLNLALQGIINRDKEEANPFDSCSKTNVAILNAQTRVKESNNKVTEKVVGSVATVTTIGVIAHEVGDLGKSIANAGKGDINVEHLEANAGAGPGAEGVPGGTGGTININLGEDNEISNLVDSTVADKLNTPSVTDNGVLTSPFEDNDGNNNKLESEQGLLNI